MRAGLSTIQQTLTPEAASVLNHSIAEAGRRNHSQTTPLHVAATLLASPTGYLRQACIKSHPNSSHPLQCRALELCFSVALDRLPTSQTSTAAAAAATTEPPISNALMAALKRAQAHQRRGCPEQQQQPLLAVKVELEQLIISILDDPSVSRVMREASFSSPAVKATIEHSINCSNAGNSNNTPGAGPNSVPPGTGLNNSVNSPIGLPFRPQGLSKNLYLNPRLQGSSGGGGGIAGGAANSSVNSGPGQSRIEEIKRVGDVLMRGKKRNPVLVGESEPQAVVKELLRRIENNEFGGDHGGVFKNVQVVRLDKEFASEQAMISGKLKELGDVVEARIGNLGGGGVIIDLGDLKWLVEQPAGLGSGTVSTQVGSEKGKIFVAEMAKLLARFSEGSGLGSGRLWLIGTATCETYLRCQVYHPTMESDWDLQAMPIAARAPLPGLFTRLGTNGTLKPPVGSLSPLKNLPIINPAPLQRLSENLDQPRKPSCCPECSQKLEQELAKLAAVEFENTSPEVKSEAAQPTLPQWLQNAKINDGDAKSVNNLQNKDQEGIRKQKAQELQKKWRETCLRSHPQFHQQNIGPDRITSTPHGMTGLYNPNRLLKQPSQPKLNRSVGEALQLSSNPLLSQNPEQVAASPPRSPVRTDLVLGQPKLAVPAVEKTLSETVKDFLGVLSSEPQIKVSEFSEKLLGKADTDSFKKLLKGLADKVWWQHDAASAVASAMTQCKLGNGKKRGSASKGDIWLLFTGPDRVGKKKMASALADLVCGASPIIISFGSRRDGEESNRNFRGKTALDRIAEAVRWNPISVIMLEDIDEADMLVRGSIKKAIERGRIADSHGREISLGNVTIILSVNWLPDNLKSMSKSISLDEEKLESLASTAWQLRLSLCEKTTKRRANWLHEERFTKPRKDTGSGFGFDLNEAADAGDDRGDGSRNSSDLTVDSDIDHGIDKWRLSTMSLVYNEFVGHVDDSIVFNPVDFAPIVQDTKDSIVKAFSNIIGNRVSIEVQDEAVQKILGGVWLGDTGLEEWTHSVLIPSFHLLRARLPSTIGMLPDESTVVRLESRSGDSGSRKDGNWLPSTVVVEGL